MQHTNDCQCQWCNLDNIIYFSYEFEYVFTLNRWIPLNWNKWWLGCRKKNCNVVFILNYTYNRSFYETSFVLRFFHLYEKNLKQNVNIWVESLNLILMSLLINYHQMYRKKPTPTFKCRWIQMSQNPCQHVNFSAIFVTYLYVAPV